MAASLNKVMLIGNLGADPVIRQTQDGKRLAQLSLATSESWKDKSTGEKKEKTSWHRIVIFNDGLAGVVESYLKKGSKVYVEGQLQTRKFTDQSGQEKYTTEVVLGNYNFGLTIIDFRNGLSLSKRTFATSSSDSVIYSSINLFNLEFSAFRKLEL